MLAQGVRIADQDGKAIEIEYSVTVEAVDLEADRDLDLVVGSERGRVLWCRNVGANDAPRYAGEPRYRAALSDDSRLATEQRMLEAKGEAVSAR